MRERFTSRNKPFFVELKENHKYLFCSCIKSENQPFCDGKSHRRTGKLPLNFTVEKTGMYYLCGCKKSKSQPFCDGTHKTL